MKHYCPTRITRVFFRLGYGLRFLICNFCGQFEYANKRAQDRQIDTVALLADNK